MSVAVIPKIIHVGKVDFEVIVDQEEWKYLLLSKGMKDAYGHMVGLEAKIYLNPKQPPSQMKLSLWHEVLHALCEAAMGSPDWRNLGKLNHNREERVVRLLEAPTLNVIADNPDLMAYLSSPN